MYGPRMNHVEFILSQRDAVVSTLGQEGEPQSVYLSITATDAGELVFDAKADSRSPRTHCCATTWSSFA